MGGYYTRSIYAIDDLKKLIHYKTARGISLKWQGCAYSYLMAFCRIAHLAPLSVPEDLPLVHVSAKATNDVICHDLRITENMAQHLGLETLRPDDCDQHRQDRHSRRVGRATREVYLQNCKDQSQQQLALVQKFLSQGLTKSAVARKLHLSRKHIYHLLNEEVSSNGKSRNEGQVQQG